jgi:hypothetical protein
MHQTDRISRRTFVKTASAAACLNAANLIFSLSSHPEESDAFRLVAETDRNRILEASDQYVLQTPLTITAFPASGSPGGLHDFYSQADYFWPNPKDPNGPYINRDGQSDPENFDAHRKVMLALSIQMPVLTAAWLLTGERRYAQKACAHLRAWFVAPETRMNPNLLYSQAVQGSSTGRSYGIIDTLHLAEVARAASFLKCGSARPGMLSAQDAAGVKSWFASYLDWLSHHERGLKERDTTNNHAFCWALQVAEFARLVGDNVVRGQVYERYQKILLPNQIDARGAFPRELARTKPYSYSIFNFDVMAGLCQSLKGLSPDPSTFHLADGRGLCKAAEFIYPYIKDKSTWKWSKDVEHFDALPVRSPGLLFSGVACRERKYIDLWKTLNPDPKDKEIIRNYPIRQPLLWV